MNSKVIKNINIKTQALKESEFYCIAVTYIRWIASPLRRIRTLFNVLKPHLWIITGTEISNRQELVIAYAGHEREKNFWSNLAFGSSIEERYIGREWLWAIHKTIKKTDDHCSLMVIEVPNGLRFLSGYFKCIFIPSWVNGEIDITLDTARLFMNENSSLKSDLSKIRRNEYTYEVTTRVSKLRDFYYSMYIPYITKVHGNRSKIMSYDYVRRQFTRSGLFNELLLVKSHDDYIAGVLLHYKKNKAKLSTLGVKDGNLEHVKKGAIGALFYFSFQHFQEKGFTLVDFGGSRPFLKDGILKYKKKWNQRISNKKEIGFLVKVLSETEGLEGFFINNPFIYEDRIGLKGAIFVAPNKVLLDEDLARMHKDYYLKGIAKLVVYRFRQTDKTNYSQMSSTLPEDMEIIPAENIFFQKKEKKCRQR